MGEVHRVLVPVAIISLLLSIARAGRSCSVFARSTSAAFLPSTCLDNSLCPPAALAFLSRFTAAQGTLHAQRRTSFTQAPSLRYGVAGAAQMSSVSGVSSSLDQLAQNADHSWMQQLNMDPETDQKAPNRESRQVRSGHYVKVLPTPLPRPKYVIHSADMAKTLGISEEDVKSERYVAWIRAKMCVCMCESLSRACSPCAFSQKCAGLSASSAGTRLRFRG
jgi:hypothetical protein